MFSYWWVGEMSLVTLAWPSWPAQCLRCIDFFFAAFITKDILKIAHAIFIFNNTYKECPPTDGLDLSSHAPRTLTLRVFWVKYDVISRLQIKTQRQFLLLSWLRQSNIISLLVGAIFTYTTFLRRSIQISVEWVKINIFKGLPIVRNYWCSRRKLRKSLKSSNQTEAQTIL